MVILLPIQKRQVSNAVSVQKEQNVESIPIGFVNLVTQNSLSL